MFGTEKHTLLSSADDEHDSLPSCSAHGDADGDGDNRKCSSPPGEHTSFNKHRSELATNGATQKAKEDSRLMDGDIDDRHHRLSRWYWGILIVAITIPSIFLNMFLVTKSLGNTPLRVVVKSENLHFDETESQKDWTDWCPYANCVASPVCKPCNRRFVFIFAAGRSGSTSLMDMINLLPNVRMSGENNGYLNHIHDMLYKWVHPGNAKRQEKLRTNPANRAFHKERKEGSWKHGLMSIPTDFACAAQKLMETINPPLKKDYFNPEFEDDDTILGFKMIRIFTKTKIEDVSKMVQFINQHFPCSRVIININYNVKKQASSGFMNGTSLAELKTTNDNLNTAFELFGKERAYSMSLQDLAGIGGVEKMNDLARWLGFRNCFFSGTFHDNDKAKGGIWVDDKKISVGDRCVSPD